jgi:competence protein ComEC
MKEQIFNWRLTGSVIFFVLSISLSIFVWRATHLPQETEIIFLSVGQGDAILIRSGMTEIIIDAGVDGRLLLSRLGRHIPFWDRTIETVIATHSDRDHIGGFPSLFRSYRVLSALTNGYEDGTGSEKYFLEVIESDGAHHEAIRAGTEIILPNDGGILSVEYPNPHGKALTDSESNEGSIIIRFTYGESTFLLTGDLPREESFLPSEQPVDILKVAHHGSRFSTSDEFLDLIQPKEAVISVGKNSYGHPSQEVIDRLMKRDIYIHRTDREGDIVYVCSNGKCQLKQ